MKPDDFPNLQAVAVKRSRIERYQQAISKIADAVESGQIRNVEYKAAKENLNDFVHDAYVAKVSDPFYYAGRYLSLSEELQAFGWEVNPSNLHDILSCANKLNRTKLTGPVVDAMKEIVSEILPLAQAVKDLKSKVVMGRAPSSEPPKPVNPNKVVRTCPCCEGAFAVQGNRMVHHGYRRPGYGSQTSSCYGIRFKPLERSNEGLVAMRNMHQRAIDDDSEKLAKKDELTQITVSRKANGGVKRIVFNKGEDGWNRQYAIWVGDLQSNIRHSEFMLKIYDEKIAKWKQTEPDPEAPSVEEDSVAEPRM